MEIVKNKGKIKRLLIVFMMMLLIASCIIAINQSTKHDLTVNASSELLRSMNYDPFVDGDEKVAGTDNVEFSAFFLRDIDNDGYADKLKGTCKEIGKEDTLYMEINVLTEGYLKNAKIEIDGKNFYFQTALPKDNELKDSYIGNNIELIEFENLNTGTQKMIIGTVCSGIYKYESAKKDAIGKNINNYSRDDNKIVLTGTYVDDEEIETNIRKEIPITIDWYGNTNATIENTSQIKSDLNNRIDEENNELKLNFQIDVKETKNELNLQYNYVEGVIPTLNGYAPTSVKLTNLIGEFNYDENTQTFTIQKVAKVNADGEITSSIASSLSYGIEVRYPLEAYNDTDTVNIKIPIQTYFGGYNNPNSEFANPYISNTASKTISAYYRMPVEANTKIQIKVQSPNSNTAISKLKPLRLYDGISTEETEDYYLVSWHLLTGTTGNHEKIVLKENKNGETEKEDKFVKANNIEESMDGIAQNVGIYFSNAKNLLSEDGEIKVYDDETDVLLVTFTNDGSNGTKKWSNYSSQNPYFYDMPVKHVRVETTSTKEKSSMTIYHLKELDDAAICEKYEKEEFDEFEKIKSNLTVYLNDNSIIEESNMGQYKNPYSLASISISKDTLSTQITEENFIFQINARGDEVYNQIGWKNGSYLIELPSEIMDCNINSVEVNNSNITILSYEILKIDGKKFIKIKTYNENQNADSYKITIETNITPDCRVSTVSRQFVLYASNEEIDSYNSKTQDLYDVDDDGNTEEFVLKDKTAIKLVAPNSLLTNQTVSEFDESGDILVDPQIVDLKPIYSAEDREKQTVKIGVQMKNNYSGTISEVRVIGKIPFEGNSYVLSGKNLNSEFSTEMTESGIQVPVELQDNTIVYYSEKTSPTKDINDVENGWTLKEDVTDWSKVKTFLIDLGNTTVDKGQEYTFSYILKIPFGIEFNKTAYSHHGIYFSLDTPEGKYRTSTEPNKIGVRIADKYNLELTKYQANKNRVVEGAIYKVSKLDNDGNVEDSNTAVTNAEGKLEMANLYAEKIYEIMEIDSPEDYELSGDVVGIVGHINRTTGELTVEKLYGETKGEVTVAKNDGEDYKARINVEDEVKASLKIIKLDKNTNQPIKGTKFKILGIGFPFNGKIVTTDANGEIDIKGIRIGEEYLLQETMSEGYYLEDSIAFKVVNTNGVYEIEIVDGELKSSVISVENDIPIINLTIENEPIPKFNLELTKIKHTTTVNGGGNQEETVYLSDAKFRLYKDGKSIGDYTTDAYGKLLIEGLYQYKEEREIGQTYTLKELLPPTGYVSAKDIVFMGKSITDPNTGEESIDFVEKLSKGQDAVQYVVAGNTIKITVEDSPIFKLTKKDGETNLPLSNVKFAIYNVDENEVPARNSKGELIGEKENIDGIEYYVVKTNDFGEVTLDLPEGLYKAVEVEADDKYNIEDQIYYFGVGAYKEPAKRHIFEWADSVGGTEEDAYTSIAKTNDGGYIAVGYFDSPTITIGEKVLTNKSDTYNVSGKTRYYEDGIIVKYDVNGDIQWSDSIGGIRDVLLTNVIVTRDGGYVVIGEYGSSNLTVGGYTLGSQIGRGSGLIIKYNSNNEVLWANRIDCQDLDIFKAITETAEGDLIVTGKMSQITKYGSDGTLKKSINGHSKCSFNSIHATSDGGYIVVGEYNGNMTFGTHVVSSSGWSGIVIKYSASDEIEWLSTRGRYLNAVTEIKAGEYVVVGSIYGDNSNSSAGLIIKYNKDGNVENSFSIKGEKSSDRVYSYVNLYDVDKVADGGYVIIGDVNSTGDNGTHIGEYAVGEGCMLLRYSSDDELKNARTIYQGAYLRVYKDSHKIPTIISINSSEYIIGGFFENSKTLNKDCTLTSKGNNDCLIMKYREEDTVEIHTESAYSMGDRIGSSYRSVSATKDGGYVAVGSFGGTVTLGDYTFTTHDIVDFDYNSESDGIIVKHSADNEIEWAINIVGNKVETVDSVVATNDGGYIVAGYSGSSIIRIGDYTYTIDENVGGILIKFDKDNKIEWINNYNYGNNASIAATNDDKYVLTVDNTILKYNKDGEKEYENILKVDEEDYCSIKSVAATDDGGYVIVGSFSNTFTEGEYTLINSDPNTLSRDGLIIKYSANNDVEWVNYSSGINSEDYNSITPTSDGGYVVVGEFNSPEITIGDYTLVKLNNEYQYNSAGMIIKYNSNGKVEWAKDINSTGSVHCKSVVETGEGGYVVVGYYNCETTVIEPYILVNEDNNISNGMVIKYNKMGEVEVAYGIGGNASDYLDSVAATIDGGYVLVGSFFSDDVKIGNYTLLHSNFLNNIIGGTSRCSNAMIIKQTQNYGVAEVTELEVNNNRKEYRITTDIKEVNGVKGGTILGEDEAPYETIKYGDNSTKDIIMIPDPGYEITNIKVNGKNYTFEANDDGTYRMPVFANVVENEHIVVTFTYKDNKITINKKDKDTGEALTGAILKLDQLESEDNSELYHTIITTDNEGKAITGIPFGKYSITELKAPDGYYINENIPDIVFSSNSGAVHEFVVMDEKKATVTVHHYKKGTTEKVAKDEVITGKIGDTYTSYPKNDLAKYTLEIDGNGEYILPANRTGEYTYEDQEVNYYYIENEIPLIVHHYIEGTETKVPLANGNEAGDVITLGIENQAYSTQAISSEELDERYELIEIPDNASGIYKDNEVIVTYFYRRMVGKLTITKVDEDGVTPLKDAIFKVYEGEEREYNVGSPINNGPIFYDIDNMTLGNEIISNIEFIENGYDGNYTFTKIDGEYIPTNSKYYQIQNGGTEAISYSSARAVTELDLSGLDGLYALVVNTEKVLENRSWAYIEYEDSNNNYYSIGLNDSKNDYTLVLQGDEKYTIWFGFETNNNPGDDIVKIKSIKLYEAEIDSNKYYFEKDNQGRYISNNGGYSETFAQTVIPIDLREYINQSFELVINAEAEIPGDAYGLILISPNLNSDFDIYNDRDVDVIEEFNGSYMPEAQDYTYSLEGGHKYYLYLIYDKSGDGYDGLDDDRMVINTIELRSLKDETLHTDENGKIELDLPVGEYNVREVSAPEGYVLPENPIQTVKLTKDGLNITIENEKIKGKVIVNHFIEGTEENITDYDDVEVKPEIKKGRYGYIYEVSPREDLYDKYELVGAPSVTSGEYTETPVTHTYYYRLKKYPYVVNYLLKDEDDDDTNNTVLKSQKSDGEIYDYGTSINSEFEKEDIYGYKIDSVNVENLKITASGNEINIYYVVDQGQTKKVNYTVEYYKDDVLVEEDVIRKSVDVQVLEPNAANIDVDSIYNDAKYTGYKIDYTVPANEPNVLNDGETLEIHYTKDFTQTKTIKYTVEYYKDGVLQENDIDEVEDTPYVLDDDVLDVEKSSINVVDKYQGYTFEKVNPDPIPDTIEDGGVIKVYYIKTRYLYRFEYYYEGEIDEIATLKGKAYKDEEYIRYTPRPKDGYEFDRVEGLPLIISDVDENVVRVYYYKIRKITVNHIDRDTNEIMDSEENEGKLGNTVTTTEEDFPGYICVEKPDVEEFTYGEDEQIVNYYYAKVSNGVLEKHIDEQTNSVLYEKHHTGEVGNHYEINSRDFTGYVLNNNRLPNNSEGEMADELIEVRYYYNKETKVIVHYIYREGNNETEIETLEIPGYISKLYEAQKKEYNDYVYVSSSNNTKGLMTEEVIDVYYYYGKSAQVVVKYVDIVTDEEIEVPQDIVGHIGDEYNTTGKDIADYVLVENTQNTKGTMGEEITEVIYYYSPKATVSVKYVDKDTGEEIETGKLIDGYIGKDYTTDRKEISGYIYESSTDNTTGKMSEKTTEVVYYYSKPVEITYSAYTINYIDSDTGKTINKSKTVEGQEVGTTIQAKALIIDIDGYTFDYFDKDSLIIKDGENVINLYYTKDKEDEEPVEEPKDEPKEEPQEEPKTEPKTDPDEEPKTEPKVEPKTEPKVEPKTETENNTTNQNSTVNKVVPKNVVPVSNTEKNTIIHQIIGTMFIILGSVIIAIPLFKKKDK